MIKICKSKVYRVYLIKGFIAGPSIRNLFWQQGCDLGLEKRAAWPRTISSEQTKQSFFVFKPTNKKKWDKSLVTSVNSPQG